MIEKYMFSEGRKTVNVNNAYLHDIYPYDVTIKAITSALMDDVISEGPGTGALTLSLSDWFSR